MQTFRDLTALVPHFSRSVGIGLIPHILYEKSYIQILNIQILYKISIKKK